MSVNRYGVENGAPKSLLGCSSNHRRITTSASSTPPQQPTNRSQQHRLCTIQSNACVQQQHIFCQTNELSLESIVG